MTDHQLRGVLLAWQFWALELLFAGVVVTTIVEARRIRIGRGTLAAAMGLAFCAWFLAAQVAPRTNRIYYDEQIYQSVGRNLSDLRLAQMCNDGSVEYGRLQCVRAEYNKEPYGYPYLLSLLYRAAGVSETVAFRFNNVVAALTVLVTVVLAHLLFGHAAIALFSGLLLTVMPMQITWSATAASEPVAALFCAASALAAVHYAQARTASALTWAILLAAFTTTMRPECLLVVPIAALAILLFAPSELRTPRLWYGVAGGLLASAVSLAHALAVRHEGWGTNAPAFAWRYLRGNLPTNAWFYLWDERFPAIVGAAAIFGLVADTFVRRTATPDSSPFESTAKARLFLLLYFLTFWTVFAFFYAGSYNYGADVRYSLLTYVPVAILGAAGIARAAEIVAARAQRQPGERRVLAAATVAILTQFLWYLPLVRATGEEAWGARADVRYAREFARQLPPNAVVLTHNPGMFHLWNVSAAQLSLLSSDAAVRDHLFARYGGGVYVHWNFWCNVSDKVQTDFCRSALDRFPHELVDRRRERHYEYALYRLTSPPPASSW